MQCIYVKSKLVYVIKCRNFMITGQSDPLMYMCFNTFLLFAFGLKSSAKPGGTMLPLAPPTDTLID